jgi:pimeloyl-ACP methyl ester carboxylesterase
MTAAFDIRCLSMPPDDLTSWDGLVQQVVQLIESEQQLIPSRPTYLCGESFGGCLALKLSARFPQLCDRLILINPASSFSGQPWLMMGAAVTPWIPDSLYRVSTLGLLPFLIAPQRVSHQSRHALLTAMKSVTAASAAWRLSLLGQFSLEQLPLARIKQPTLVLAAGADRLLPSVTEAEKLVKYLPNAQKIILPDSGHACLLETGVQLGKMLRSWQYQLPAVGEKTPINNAFTGT